jgi:hypothetical protein
MRTVSGINTNRQKTVLDLNAVNDSCIGCTSKWECLTNNLWLNGISKLLALFDL